jgi:hypothetical protein
MVLRERGSSSRSTATAITRSPVFIALLGAIVCLLLLVLAMGMVLRKVQARTASSQVCVACTAVQYAEAQPAQLPGYPSHYQDGRKESQSNVSVVEASTLTVYPTALQVMNRSTTGLSESATVIHEHAQQERADVTGSPRSVVQPDRRVEGLASWPQPIHKWDSLSRDRSIDLEPRGGPASTLNGSSREYTVATCGPCPNPSLYPALDPAMEYTANRIKSTAHQSAVQTASLGLSSRHSRSLTAHRPRPRVSARQTSQLSSSWIPDHGEETDFDGLKDAEVRQVTAVAYPSRPSSPKSFRSRGDSRYPAPLGQDHPLQVMLSLPYELAERGRTPIPKGSTVREARGYPMVS